MVERVIQARVLVAGEAEGEALVLPEPLSLWGGLNPATGEIIDRHHPSSGQNVAGRVLILPMGRGSSSASSVLLEAVRQQVAPAAIIMAEVDGILVLGAVVAQEIYGVALPVLVADANDYARFQTGQHVQILADGEIQIG